MALVGATNNVGKRGGMILANVLVNAYQGRVYPVTPRGEAILGREGLDLYPTPERVVRVMARLMGYAAYLRRVGGTGCG